MRRLVPTPVKRTIGGFRHRYRLATARTRRLPDFLVIGAQKSGTTSLHSSLIQHPQIFGACVKEVHFFDKNFSKGDLWYRAHFPIRHTVPSGCIVGESSPYYLFHPHAPERIRGELPHAKLIAILRNPVERAISHYFHEAKKSREDLPIMEALLAEDGRIEPEVEKMLEDERFYSRVHRSYSYKRRGVYIEQLSRYREYRDNGQLLVLASEEFFTEPHRVLEEVFAFLGVDPTFVCGDIRPKNVGMNRRDVPPAVYEYLNSYFAPYNERLYRYIGRDFGW
jgi:hypothetical protein